MATIDNLTTSWEGHTKGEVEDFIKQYLGKVNAFENEKAACIGFKGMTGYLFASAEDKQEWENTGVENWIDTAEIKIVGTERKIQITNLSGNNNPYFTTSGRKAEITVSFKSLYKDVMDSEWSEDASDDAFFTVSVDRGATGSWTVIASDEYRKQGETYTIDVFNYLAVGANRIIIKAVGSATGAVGQLNITANLTQMYLSPANFAWYKPFVEGEAYNLGGVNIGGNLDKTIYIRISNDTGYSVTYEERLYNQQFIDSAYYYSGLQFPTSAGTGVYNIEMWLVAQGSNIESDHLRYNIMCVAAADVGTAELVAISSAPASVTNYADNTLFQYAVYNKGLTIATPAVDVTAEINNNPFVVASEVLADVPVGIANNYQISLEIESEETNMSLTAKITLGECEQMAVYTVDNSASYPATSGATFYMNASTRGNAQANREKIVNIINGDKINATWTRMSWVDGIDGHTIDDTGRKCLFIPAGSRCEIDLQPLASVGGGKTLEFTYKASNVADYTDPIITIADDVTSASFNGLIIRPSNILLHSRGLKDDLAQGIDVKDEEVVNTQFTMIRNYKVDYGNLAQIYVNGVKARSFAFDASDSWINNGKLILGNDTTDLYIYNIRVYDVGFGKESSEQNFIASLPLSSEKKAMYALINGVRDTVGDIDFDAVDASYNTMVVRMLNNAELPRFGLSKEYSAYCDVTFSFKNMPSEYQVKNWKFALANCRIEGQGTTSMSYFRWNLRWRLEKSDNLGVTYLNE